MLSLIVPIYNMEKLLPRCIDTMLNQTSRDFEIILVDDGSTDKTPLLCDQYAKKYPNFIRVVHKKNGGLSSARNAGIRIATGSHVVFPDPDDCVEEDYVEKAIKLLKKTPDMVCLGYFIDYENKSIEANPNGKELIFSCSEAQLSLMEKNGIRGFAWNKFYRLEIICENGLEFKDDTGTVEDLDFAYQYLSYCDKITFAPQFRVYHYHQRHGTATNSGFSKKQLENIRTYKKIITDTTNPLISRYAKEEICNLVINLTLSYKKSGIKDEMAWLLIRKNLRKYLPTYLGSKKYGIGRKLQGILALVFPSLYAVMK